MQRRYHRIIYVVLVGILFLGACNFPGESTPKSESGLSEGALYTAAAVTIQAQMTGTAAAQAPPQALVTPAPSETMPPPLPPATTEVPAAVTPEVSPTSEVPLISASVNTNCRLGPGKVYDPPVGALLVSQQVEVHGRNDSKTWWYIENPGRPGQFCWVWAQTTKVEGDTNTLPIITPPPPPPTATPTATPGIDFSVAYETAHACGGFPTAIFRVTNVGSAKFESLDLDIEDLTLAITFFSPVQNAPFMGAAGECPPGSDAMQVGQTRYIGRDITGIISGHAARAHVTLCTEDALGGTCVQKNVDFTIP